ncbi:hypothetical protein JCM10207_000005 [Rhodosporidiobolus poonsookiae]
MEVRLRCVDTPWSCQISLRFERDADNKPVETVREVPFGAALSDPTAVEAALRRAQLAILNPSVDDVQYFLGMSDGEVDQAKKGKSLAKSKRQLSFSTNLVCLDISGPSVVDLAFVDLPGIISNSETPGDIELIESMVQSNIKGNCLILLTITMRDDYQNQKAVLLATEADPNGERTIGVLTKADTVQHGEHSIWLAMLEGKTHALKHGFFATKQPGPADLERNLSFEEARALEAQFSTQAPWSTANLALKNRFGVANLTKFLSVRLAEYIASKLPGLHQHLLSSLSSVLASIEKLPPAPSADPVSKLHVRISSLSHELAAIVRGDAGYGELIQAKNRNDKHFMAAIRATKPAFVPFETSATGEIQKWGEKRHTAEKAKSLNAEKQVNGIVESSTRNKAIIIAAKPSVSMKLDEVQRHIEEHKARELPLNTPYGARASLMIEALAFWGPLSEEALKDMRKPIERAVDGAMERYFGRSSDNQLRGVAMVVCTEVVDDLFASASTRLADYTALEAIPYTQNRHYFQTMRDTALNHFKEARHPDSAVKKDDELVRGAMSALAKLGLNGVKVEQLQALQQADPFEEELEAMAMTVAYWKVAYKRFVDDVPRIIDHALLRPLPSALSAALFKRLVSGGEDEIRRLMSESKELADERAELVLRKKRLEEAKKVLAAFGSSL